jgi:hypothetical protein
MSWGVGFGENILKNLPDILKLRYSRKRRGFYRVCRRAGIYLEVLLVVLGYRFSGQPLQVGVVGDV